MRTILSLLLIAAGCSFSYAENFQSSYSINEQQVDALFDQSSDLTFVLGQDLTNFGQAAVKYKDMDKHLLAGIVALASWVTGIGVIIPFHRFVLGTDGHNGKIFILYCITLSGCGFVLLIDGILLIIDSSGDKYIENSRFIMW